MKKNNTNFTFNFKLITTTYKFWISFAFITFIQKNIIQQTSIKIQISNKCIDTYNFFTHVFFSFKTFFEGFFTSFPTFIQVILLKRLTILDKHSITNIEVNMNYLPLKKFEKKIWNHRYLIQIYPQAYATDTILL